MSTAKITAKLPTEFGEFTIFVYPEEQKEHLALVKGDPQNKENVLVRIHSECLTGEVFHSLKCDCREQLMTSLNHLKKEKEGMIIYLRQEGRGVGLSNKIKQYHLQDQGLDTVEASEKMGVAVDSRDYHIAAKILKEWNIHKIRLMTNNPDKITKLEQQGITVKRIPLQIKPNKNNRYYLKIKKEKLGHIL